MPLLTTSFAKSTDCIRRAGLKSLKAIEASLLTSFTKATAGDVYSAVTIASAAAWFSYQFQEYEAELRENMEGQDGAYQWTQEVEIKLPGMNKTVQKIKKELADASGCGLILIAETLSGYQFVVGYSEIGGKVFPAKLKSDATTSGKAGTDHPGSVLVLGAVAPEPMWTFTGTIS